MKIILNRDEFSQIIEKYIIENYHIAEDAIGPITLYPSEDSANKELTLEVEIDPFIYYP